MPRPEGVLSMKARSLFARKHRRFVAISQGGLSTFKLQKPEDIAVLETRKDLPFDYVEGVRLDGSRFVVKRRKPWRSDVVFYCATAPAARAWAEALRSRLDAFRNKARVQFPPLNESLGPNLSPRPELPPYPPASPARLKAGQVDVAGELVSWWRAEWGLLCMACGGGGRRVWRFLRLCLCPNPCERESYCARHSSHGPEWRLRKPKFG